MYEIFHNSYNLCQIVYLNLNLKNPFMNKTFVILFKNKKSIMNTTCFTNTITNRYFTNMWFPSFL